MKKPLALALIGMALIFAVAAHAQEATPADKDKAMQYLESTKKNILGATKGFSDAQWNFKAAPDRWSVAQTQQHGVILRGASFAPEGSQPRNLARCPG